MTNKELYRTFCSSHAVPLFLKDWWLDATCPGWEVAIVHNGDNIAGIWPYCTETKIGVTLLRDQVLTPYTGPYVFYPHDLKPAKRDNFQYETIQALLQQLPPAGVWHISTLPGLKQAGLFVQNGFEVGVRQTFIMPLEADSMDDIFARLHEDYRRNVRKAKQELEITSDPAMLQQLWTYQKATLDRKEVHMHFTQQQLQQLFDACTQHGACALWTARKDGEVQAILWQVWDEQHAYYLVGSKNPAAKDNRAMTALLWHAIEAAHAMGKKGFDFEGSMDAGVEKFFRNFGGKRQLYLVLRKNNSLLWKLKQWVKG